jgi:hypothetical protein
MIYEYSLNGDSSGRPCPTTAAANARELICDNQRDVYSYVCTLQKVSKTSTPTNAANGSHTTLVAFNLLSIVAMLLLQFL